MGIFVIERLEAGKKLLLLTRGILIEYNGCLRMNPANYNKYYKVKNKNINGVRNSIIILTKEGEALINSQDYE